MEAPLRIALLGTPDFAVPTLHALHEAGHEIALVVAQPDAPAGRGQQLKSPPVALAAKALGLPLAQPRAIRKGTFHDRFLALELDVAVVIAYGRLLPQSLLDAPKLGCVNLHASLLPRWRGAAPIQASVLHGDARTGVCAQRMVQALDEGPLYASESLALDPRETSGSLHDKLSLIAARVALAALGRAGQHEPVPQDEAGATHAPKIDKRDGALDLTLPAEQLDRRLRAMSPWPGGFIEGHGGPLKVLEATVREDQGRPGELLSTKPLVVACGTGALELITVQAPGKRPVSGFDYANGARLQPGATLLSAELR